ncbi:MAG: tetratricopeptide repeat protein [Armatimonadia bacterium]|nr:tetratricopeptide repeat protein [Armatimonadia bacterium]
MEEEIRYLLDRGEDGDDEEAVRLCDEALRGVPGDATMLALKSEALRNLDMYEEAVELARQATLARNGAAFTHFAYGSALLDLAEEEDRPELLERAEAALREAIDRDEKHSEARFWLAEALARRGEGSAAVEELARLGVDDEWSGPKVARLVRLIADGARPRLPAEREPGHRHPDACRSLAIALRAAGAMEAARAELEEARRADPLSPELDFQSAVTAYVSGDPAEALRLAQPALAFPRLVDAAELAATCALALGDAAEAEQHLRDALRRAERLGAPEAYLMHLDTRIKAVEGSSEDVPGPPSLVAPPEQEIPASAARDKWSVVGFASREEYATTMAATAMARLEDAAKPEVAARFIARTARYYAPPEMADDCWKGASRQMGPAWESLAAGERLQVAGILLVGEWLAGAHGLPSVDGAVLALAAVGSLRSSAKLRRMPEETLQQVEEVATGVGAAPRPMPLDEAWQWVARVLGPVDGEGLLHAVAAAPRDDG